MAKKELSDNTKDTIGFLAAAGLLELSDEEGAAIGRPKAAKKK